MMMILGDKVPQFYIYKLPIVRFSGCYWYAYAYTYVCAYTYIQLPSANPPLSLGMQGCRLIGWLSNQPTTKKLANQPTTLKIKQD